MKFFRIVFSIVGLLILVCVLAVGSLVYFVDPNKMKPVITQEVLVQTGYQLHIDGDLSWSFFPRLAIKITHMTLTAPTDGQPFLDLQDVRIAADVLQLLHGLQSLQGEISIAKIEFMHAIATNAQTTLHWQRNVLTLFPISASLYGGSLRGQAHGRSLAVHPAWDWDVVWHDVQLKPLLHDVTGGSGMLTLSGLCQMKSQGSTQGKTQPELIRNLNAASEWRIDQGVLEGVDLNYLVQTADALMNKQPVTLPTEFKQTSFTSLTASLNAKDGVATTTNLLLVAKKFVAKGTGQVNLMNDTINFHLQINPQTTLKTQWEVPIEFTGTLSHPSVGLDRTTLELFLAKQDLQKVKNKASEEIKKHVPGKAGEFLQNLLGN